MCCARFFAGCYQHSQGLEFVKGHGLEGLRIYAIASKSEHRFCQKSTSTLIRSRSREPVAEHSHDQKSAGFDCARYIKDSRTKLDSEIALHILAMTKQWGHRRVKGRVPQNDCPGRRHIELLCQAARNIRRLAILLAVDPVRGWIYAQTGHSGISLLAALAHASEAIDTFLAASLRAPEPLSSYDMADQFTTQIGHPYPLAPCPLHGTN